jgi:hypothetical protein
MLVCDTDMHRMCRSPRTISESVPTVKDAFLPTASVEFTAKAWSVARSSASEEGSTKGSSGRVDDVAIAHL